MPNFAAIFGHYPDIPELKLSLPFWVIGGRMSRCKYVRLAEILFLYFCKRKTRGETQFWIELAAPYKLANHNKMNSDDTLPFIIFFKTLFSCDGSNRLWRQHLLLPVMFPMTSYKGIRRLSTARRRIMPNVSPSHCTILLI